MIKYLKKLWNKYFKGLGYSRTKTEVEVVKHTPTDLPILIVKSKPLHCAGHNRFKKSCPDCLTAVGVK
jgi:hypothetical protein